MKLSKSLTIVFLTLMLLLPVGHTYAARQPAHCAPLDGPEVRATSINGLLYNPGEVLVAFKSGIGGELRKGIAQAAGSTGILREIGPPGAKNIWLLQLGSGVCVEEAVEGLEARQEVLYAEPNYLRFALHTPQDPDFPMQWGLHNTGQEIKGVAGTPGADIDAARAWDIEKGYTNPVTVAVLDSGIDFSHPDLDSRIWENQDEIPGNKVDDDGNGYIDDLNGFNFAGVSQTCFYYLSGGSLEFMSRKFGEGPTSRKYAQSIVGTGQELTHVGILLDKVGSPAQGIRVSVRADLSGPDICSFYIDPSDVGVFMGKVYKQLSSALTLVSGNTYYLVFETFNEDAANYYNIYENQGSKNGDIYEEGQGYYWNGTQWKVSAGDDFYFKTNPNPYPLDDHGHGTYVSGIIGAESDGQGITGISFGCELMPLKVLDASGVPSGALNTAEIIEALYYAADNGAEVVNMSLGSYWPSDLEQEAVNYAHDKGVVLVAAAGNDGDATTIYPAGCEKVIGVGATTNKDEKASFSNYNSSVDVTAPGKDVYSTVISGGYAYGSGTSAATPMVSGLAALVRSHDDSLSADQVEQAIKDNADDLGEPGRDDYFGFGRINAFKTLGGIDDEPQPDEPPAQGSLKRYFAEGTCRPGFDSYLCIQNPGDEDVGVTITYMLGDGTTREQHLLAAKRSRSTVNVKGFLGEGDDAVHDFSACVEAPAASGIIAERPVYFTYGPGGWRGGHDVVAASSPAATWYFAEGYTGNGFDEWICVLNPGECDANLEFNFQTSEEGPLRRTGYSVPARSRQTFKVNDVLGEGFQASLRLDSDQPVVAERVMYFDYMGTGAHGWQGGHCVMGATSLGKEFYFAEGCTREGFEEWITLQNPHTEPISVEAVYQVGQGQGAEVVSAYDVGAESRLTLLVRDEVGEGKDVSIRLTSDADFLAERPMYFDYRYPGLEARGGHCVIGAASPAWQWHFAEGYTGAAFSQWLCLQNPGDQESMVEISYYTQEEGPLDCKAVTVPANSRDTIMVNEHAGAGYQLSCSVEVDSGPAVIVERPIYFNHDGRDGGHDVLGYTPSSGKPSPVSP